MKKCAVAFLVLVCACGSDAAVQGDTAEFLAGATVISGDPTCLDCSLEIELVSDLGEEKDDSVLKEDLRAVLVVPTGIFLTTSVPGPPLFYGVNGAFRIAAGVAAVAGDSSAALTNSSVLKSGASDTILVYDATAKTISYIDSTLKSVRTVAVSEQIADLAVLADGDVIVATPTAAGDSVTPLSRISLSTGQSSPLRATSVPVPAGADAEFSNRMVAAARDGAHFWSVHKLRYVIEKRSLSGDLVTQFERDVSWFRPSVSVAAVTPDAPPTPRVMGVWEDARGLLWIHLVTADARWQKAMGAPTTVDGKKVYPLTGPDLYRDTRIEVIDPNNGTLVATAVWDTVYPVFASGPFMARILPGLNGWLVGEVWNISLTGYK